MLLMMTGLVNSSFFSTGWRRTSLSWACVAWASRRFARRAVFAALTSGVCPKAGTAAAAKAAPLATIALAEERKSRRVVFWFMALHPRSHQLSAGACGVVGLGSLIGKSRWQPVVLHTGVSPSRFRGRGVRRESWLGLRARRGCLLSIAPPRPRRSQPRRWAG